MCSVNDQMQHTELAIWKNTIQLYIPVCTQDDVFSMEPSPVMFLKFAQANLLRLHSLADAVLEDKDGPSVIE